jgi:hypothetical protein
MNERKTKKKHKIYNKKNQLITKKKNVNGWFIFLFFAHLPLLTKQLFFGGVNFFVIIFFPGINTRKKKLKKKQKKFENMYTIGVKVTKQRTVWPYVFILKFFYFSI